MLFVNPFTHPEIATFEADGYYVQEWIMSFTLTNFSIAVQFFCIAACCLLFRKMTRTA